MIEFETSIVLTNGCFDGLHYGHVQLLQEAKKLGSKLIVLVDSDKSLDSQKGSRRLLPEHERLAMIQALGCVDEARLYNACDLLSIIMEICPSYYVKGADYDLGSLKPYGIIRTLEEVGTKIEFIPLNDTKFRVMIGLVKSFKELFLTGGIEK